MGRELLMSEIIAVCNSYQFAFALRLLEYPLAPYLIRPTPPPLRALLMTVIDPPPPQLTYANDMTHMTDDRVMVNDSLLQMCASQLMRKLFHNVYRSKI